MILQSRRPEISTKEKKRYRWRKRLLWGLLGVWLLWLVGANGFLNSAWGKRTANPRPQRMQINWGWAITFFPCQVTVLNLSITGSKPRVSWQVKADRAGAWVNPFKLRSKEAHLHRVRGRGVVTTVSINPNAPRQQRSRRWTTVLHGMRVSDVRTIQINDFQLDGDSRVAGTLRLEAGGPVFLEEIDLRVLEGHFIGQERTIFRDVEARLLADAGPLEPGPKTLEDILPLISAKLALRGEADHLDFLDYYLDQTPWLTLDGAGELNLDLHLADGIWQNGTKLRTAGDLEATFLDSYASGKAAMDILVTEINDADKTLLVCRFESYELDHLENQHSFIRGEGLEMLALSNTLHLNQAPEDIELEVHIPESDVPDLRYYNQFFPESAGLKILSGDGKIQGKLCFSAEELASSAAMRLEADNLRARFDRLNIQGKLILDTKLQGINIDEGVWDAAGSSLRIANARVSGDLPEAGVVEDWWTNLTVRYGDLIVGRPMGLDAELALSMRDIKPFLTYFGQRQKTLAWVTRHINTDEVFATADVTVHDNTIQFSPLHIESGRLDLKARIKLHARDKLGQFLLSYGNLSAGIEHRNEDQHIHLVRAKKWFESGVGWK